MHRVYSTCSTSYSWAQTTDNAAPFPPFQSTTNKTSPCSSGICPLTQNWGLPFRWSFSESRGSTCDRRGVTRLSWLNSSTTPWTKRTFRAAPDKSFQFPTTARKWTTWTALSPNCICPPLSYGMRSTHSAPWSSFRRFLPHYSPANPH